ncbi:conserved hypothetical protein [Methylobacterium nodulans ORS 2060]|uniref:Uncharacterized protein n=1 Tax=Methylobacterium nodulans (strain LMG 21967 / CNCM I-2342 / ORS 2060) TaxID=460265 RepID=B8IQS8_METNO|nr:conserved hypothetical protein [Methylobacterium nodulans ORS 2060]
MSSLHKRSAARVLTPNSLSPPLVPPEIHARYAEIMAKIPRVRLDVGRPAKMAEPLPAVSSFYS